jgi:hypothetical protein
VLNRFFPSANKKNIKNIMTPKSRTFEGNVERNVKNPDAICCANVRSVFLRKSSISALSSVDTRKYIEQNPVS